MNWTIEDGNYVTYYNISYTPSCPELSSVNVTVFVVPYTTTYSYTLRELYSGMNYTITVQNQQVIQFMFNSFYQNLVPTGNINSLYVLQINQTSIRIMWEEVDCDQHNGKIIEYIVIISNNNYTYNLTSTERYITVNDLVLGGIYNINVAAVNSIGIGPLSDNIELQIVTCYS